MKAVFLDAETIGPDVSLTPIETVVDSLTCWPYTPEALVHERIADMDIVITNKVKLDKATISQAGQLKLICVAATGMNNVDLNAAEQRGIPVKNVADYAAKSVAQHCWSLMLALTNHLGAYQHDVASGRWSAHNSFCLNHHDISELYGKTLGIIGYGAIAKEVEKIANAFDMNIAIANRVNQPAQEGRVPLHELLKVSDIVSVHCPLTDETHHLIGAAELQLMKPDALIINTARGGIIHETDLVKAIDQGVIGGAGIDVLTQEPPGNKHPLLTFKHSRLIVTPHCAWASQQARTVLVRQLANHIQKHRHQ